MTLAYETDQINGYEKQPQSRDKTWPQALADSLYIHSSDRYHYFGAFIGFLASLGHFRNSR